MGGATVMADVMCRENSDWSYCKLFDPFYFYLLLLSCQIQNWKKYTNSRNKEINMKVYSYSDWVK